MKKIILPCLILITGFVAGFSWRSFHMTVINPPVDVRENSPEYSFVNPLIFSRVSKQFYVDEYKQLTDSLEVQIQKMTHEGPVQSVSVYYRDLNNGHWTGINENQRYHPSSMLKVLGLMAYMRWEEQSPTPVLSKKLLYTPEVDRGQYYKPSHVLERGYYEVGELLKQMIVYSDNSVLGILDREDRESIFSKTYHTFQLPLASTTEDIDGFMSPRSYSALFRALYNATYLSRDDSEKALKLLSITDFTKGIVDGIPKNIVIAHKFGEHSYELETGQVARRELHDCGIIYYPQRPYLLCVMTQGSNFSDLEKAISGISKLVYDYVDKNTVKS